MSPRPNTDFKYQAQDEYLRHAHELSRGYIFDSYPLPAEDLPVIE